ncbi:MAG: serine protease, partial [Patescibacteria group bacterium]|nr:serine protease [Patescibacteria group bacterium]
MFELISHSRPGTWMGATCAALVAAMVAAVGFTQWSPPGRLQHGSPTSPTGPSSEMSDDSSARKTADETVEGTASPANETFVNPEQVARQFCRQLAALVKEGNVVSPSELARQVARETKFPMQTVAASSGKLSADAIYARAKKSVVIVGGINPSPGRAQWRGTFATGFVARKDGVILTNAHVIDAFAETTAIGIMTDDGRVFPVTAVLAADLENDVAAIKVDADDLAPLPIVADVRIG